MTDFRVCANFFTHLKTRKLQLRLGDAGTIAHLRLFAYAAEHRPSGELTGMTVEDVEVAAEWRGLPGSFVEELISLRLLDVSEVNQTLTIHNWRTHNQWVSESSGRIKNAHLQNHRRWHQARGIVEPTCCHCQPSITDQPGSVTDSATDENASVNVSPLRYGTVRNEKEGESSDASTDKKCQQRVKATEDEAGKPLPSSASRRTRVAMRFDEDAVPYRLSALLLELIRSHNPGHLQPDLQKWATTVDLMMRRDKRNPAEIEKIIRFAQADLFWFPNILSTESLRKHFDQLVLKSLNTAASPRSTASAAERFQTTSVPFGVLS